MKPKLKDLKWWGVDFDNCVCETRYNPKTDKWDMIRPMEGVAQALEFIHGIDKKIIIYTSRGWEEYIEIEEFMHKHNLPYDLIVCGKLLVEVMIDDRAHNFNGDWTDTLVRAGGDINYGKR